MTKDHPGEIVVTPETTAKINLTVLIAVMGSLVGATFYVSSLTNSIDRMDSTLRDVRSAVERLDARMDVEQRNIHELQLQIEAIQERVRRIESRDK